MSKSLLLTILAAVILCQVGTTQSSDYFPEKYRSFTVGFGPRTLNTSPGTILAAYVDDSPSMDNFSTSTVVEDKYSRVGLNLAFNFGRFKGLSHSIAFDISMGQHGGALFYYSLGYSLPFELGAHSIVIRPALNLGFGNYGFDIGELENNGSYIQIGTKEYYSSSLDLHLQSQTFVYGPALDFHYMLDQFKIFANVAYDKASSNSNPQLTFIAPSSSDEGQSSLDIDGENPNVTFDGAKLEALPYEASGLRLTVGIGYVWTKD